ncbi:hypothetical protein LCGC14_2740300 [marine sediment metagenome]|uniref:Uncharacterized protein n=1 Tax=marine sediment metagenome TaxID=412755 RepID=A0A0F9BDI2_9ZZZZ
MKFSKLKRRQEAAVQEAQGIIDSPRPLQFNATKFVIYRERLKYLIGALLNACGIAGVVQEIEFYDEVTGQQFSVRIDRYFTTISVGPRDYSFRRLTGKFDGTGYQMKCPIPPADLEVAKKNRGCKRSL